MKKVFIVHLILLALIAGQAKSELGKKHKILIISSYHREYLWSQDTQKGLCNAMVDFAFLDSKDQADKFTKDDYIESSSAIVKKAWMDTKRKIQEVKLLQLSINLRRKSQNSHLT